MAATLTLDDIRKAWDARDPRLIKLIEQLVQQAVPRPTTPIRKEALTFDKFLLQLKDWKYRHKTREEQAHYRIETLKALESPDAEVPLADKLKVHEVIYALWLSDDPLARDYLLRIIATVPVVYGPWKALKKIFKESEAKHDTEVYGAISARIDAASAAGGYGKVSGATLAYCARRAWRYLRRIAVQLPATYPDAASDYLINYTDNTQWRSTWVYNHILFHDTKKYGRNRFRFGYRDQPDPTNLKHRAYGDLWKRSHRPLFSLLDRAKSDPVRSFAISALKTDFREKLRETEPSWVIRLVGVPSAAIHDFVVWILENVPKFEQGAFRTLGLHEYVLKLFDSPSQAAREYAAKYARTHARDLSVDDLIRLANNDNDKVRKLAFDLLGELDPRKGVGLEAWGRLLETAHGSKFAGEAITKHFGAKELTPEWFAGRLLSSSSMAFDFASKLLPKTHTVKDLGPAFYIGLIRKYRQGDSNSEVLRYATHDLARHFALDGIDPEQLRWLALFPPTSNDVFGWVQQNKLKAQTLGLDFWKMVAFQPDWDASTWLPTFKAANGAWAKELSFDEGKAAQILAWFRDVRKLTPTELGFDWLMRLVARSEPMYHDFASERLIKTFVPADFAPRQDSGSRIQDSAKPAAKFDLSGATVSFTGKLATMSNSEGEGMVKAAGGKSAANVSPKLHYLVVGDSGSPFLGTGEKGAKHVKAEELNAAGANIRIISESMFLRLLSGESIGAAPADATTAGCERLWQLVIAPGPADAPVGKFAREYMRQHHTEIATKLSGKAPDPGAEIPASFLSLERVFPLFSETRKPLRDFALELASYEFARWNPNVDYLVAMSDIPFMDVRRFVAKSLLAEDTPPNRPFRLDPTKLEASAVYRFCESNDEETRALGMELIKRQPRLRVPEELFRLSESPDRKVRAFVIRALWSVYRDRGVTAEWKPPPPPKPTVGAKAKKDAEKAAVARGDGVPHKPEQWPAAKPTLGEFLRRILFEIPPGRPEKSRDAVDDGTEPGTDPNAAKPEKVVSVKPLPARRAKLDLVEVMRDLALEQKDFGGGILPLLDEFMTSRGPSERAACLVAVTRIRHKYPEFKKA